MALDLTTAAFALKKLWPTDRIERLVYDDQPLLALLPKETDFVGANFVQPLMYGLPQGRSATFANAQTNKGNTKGDVFTVTRRRDYSLVSIDGETIEAAGNDKGAVINALDTEVEGGMLSAKKSLGSSLYGSGSGSIGQIATSGISSATITLANTEDIVHFEPGMVLQTSTADGGGSVNSGTITVSTVDRDNGKFTCTGNVTSGISSAADADYIFQDGDYDAKVIGLRGWIPSSVTGTTFYGLDRTKDSVRLGGCRLDATAMAIEEALLKGAVRVDREGGKLTHYFLSHAHWLNLEYALGSKVQYMDVENEIGIGFRALRIMGPKGPIAVLADVNCQNTIAWGLTLPTWKLKTLGPAPKFLMLDGNKMLRESSADRYEARIGYYGALVCKAPGYNIRVTLPAASILT